MDLVCQRGHFLLKETAGPQPPPAQLIEAIQFQIPNVFAQDSRLLLFAIRRLPGALKCSFLPSALPEEALAEEDSLATAVPPDSLAFFAFFFFVYETPASRTRPPFAAPPCSCSAPGGRAPSPRRPPGFLGRG